MAPHFFFPQTLRALEEEHEDNRLCAQNPIDIASLHPSELEEFVKGHSLSLYLFLCRRDPLNFSLTLRLVAEKMQHKEKERKSGEHCTRID